MLAVAAALGGSMVVIAAVAWWLRRRGRELDDAEEDKQFEPPLVTGQYPGGNL